MSLDQKKVWVVLIEALQLKYAGSFRTGEPKLLAPGTSSPMNAMKRYYCAGWSVGGWRYHYRCRILLLNGGDAINV